MKSSTNLYISNLDHLRAYAAFMVFIWHFTHHNPGCAKLCYQTDYDPVVNWPFFTLLEQGHTGVALFLCITGYIFTRLTHGKKLNLAGFWKNRLLRLFPLIIFVGTCTLILQWAMTNPPFAWPQEFRFFRPITHPGGSWTVYLELRYYIFLPLILWAIHKYRPIPLLLWLLLASFIYRAIQWHLTGSVQFLAYNKLIGRMDQFLAGSLAFYVEQWLYANRPNARKIVRIAGVTSLAGLVILFHYFSQAGGFYTVDDKPSPWLIWVFIPLLEGVFYSVILVAYLTLALPTPFDKVLSAIGRWSYSIYLNHFLLVPVIFTLITYYIFMPQGFYERVFMASFVAFPIIIAISAATYRFVELPFLRFRRPYLK